MRLYKKVELEEGVPVQYLAVYALRWRPEWGEPRYGFVEVSDRDDLLEAKQWVEREIENLVEGGER